MQNNFEDQANDYIGFIAECKRIQCPTQPYEKEETICGYQFQYEKNAFMIWLYGTSMKRANEKGNFKQSFNMQKKP